LGVKNQSLCDAMNYSKIKLHRKHIPLHPKLIIRNQDDYDVYIATLLYLLNQVQLGFDPKWLVSFHYQHPSEHGKLIKETDKPYGFGDRYHLQTKGNIWKEVPYYNYLSKRRNTEEWIYDDASQIRNVILKDLYGIKRLNQVWKYEFPNLFFFHEKGKTKLQYHTHLLLTAINLRYNSEEELVDIFNNSIKKKRRCFSNWKIDITPVNNSKGVIGYLNKETNANHISFDPFNSIPIIPHN
jgi:hypothetical protein